MAKRRRRKVSKDYFGIGYVVSVILAIIPVTSLILGIVTRLSEGKIVAAIVWLERHLDRRHRSDDCERQNFTASRIVKNQTQIPLFRAGFFLRARVYIILSRASLYRIPFFQPSVRRQIQIFQAFFGRGQPNLAVLFQNYVRQADRDVLIVRRLVNRVPPYKASLFLRRPPASHRRFL